MVESDLQGVIPCFPCNQDNRCPAAEHGEKTMDDEGTREGKSWEHGRGGKGRAMPGTIAIAAQGSIQTAS